MLPRTAPPRRTRVPPSREMPPPVVSPAAKPPRIRPVPRVSWIVRAAPPRIRITLPFSAAFFRFRSRVNPFRSRTRLFPAGITRATSLVSAVVSTPMVTVPPLAAASMFFCRLRQGVSQMAVRVILPFTSMEVPGCFRFSASPSTIHPRKALPWLWVNLQTGRITVVVLIVTGGIEPEVFGSPGS